MLFNRRASATTARARKWWPTPRSGSTPISSRTRAGRASSTCDSRACPPRTIPRRRCSPATARSRRSASSIRRCAMALEPQSQKGDPEAIRRRYLKVDTATVADVLDVLGLPDQGLAPQFAPCPANAGRMGGWKVTARQVPVPMPGATIESVTVHPGDFVLADADGVIVVPSRVSEKVLVEAERATKQEVRIRRDLDRGASLEDVLKKYGHV